MASNEKSSPTPLSEMETRLQRLLEFLQEAREKDVKTIPAELVLRILAGIDVDKIE